MRNPFEEEIGESQHGSFTKVLLHLSSFFLLLCTFIFSFLFIFFVDFIFGGGTVAHLFHHFRLIFVPRLLSSLQIHSSLGEYREEILYGEAWSLKCSWSKRVESY